MHIVILDCGTERIAAAQRSLRRAGNEHGQIIVAHKLLGTMTEDNRVQSLAVSEITTAISAMDQATQQNAAMVEQTSAAARTMTSEVQGLADSAARFTVGNERGATSTFTIPTQKSAVQARPAGKPKSPGSLPTIAAAASKSRAAAADGAGWRDF
jgi:methyl-accepting chemotaxis protein